MTFCASLTPVVVVREEEEEEEEVSVIHTRAPASSPRGKKEE